MFSSRRYHCANIPNSAEATLVCNQEGCKVYPFLCVRSHCNCMALHRRHQCVPLVGLLEELETPLALPESLIRDYKEIDGFIGKIIGDLESLRKRHLEHIEKHSMGCRRSGGLLQRLIQGEPLHSNEANGDSINKMILEANSGN